MLLVLCQYILCLMLFIIDNPNNFQTVSQVQGLHTGSNYQLFIQNTNLTPLVLKYIIVAQQYFKP